MLLEAWIFGGSVGVPGPPKTTVGGSEPKFWRALALVDTRMTTHGDGGARHTTHSERTTRLESKRAQSMRGAQVHWAAATVINPAHASHSTTDGKRKKYWRVAHSRSSTLGSARSRELRVRSQ